MSVTYEDVLDFPYWFHRIPLDGDRYTPGHTGVDAWRRFDLPADLSGKSVLDIGSYNGLFAFGAERRGAERVLATDLWETDTRDRVPAKDNRREGFELVRSYLDSDVEARSIGVHDVSPGTVGRFDVVLMPGVVYHLTDPFGAVENACSVARELVVVQSVTSVATGTVGMEWAGVDGVDGDPTVWWLPDLDCLEGMVAACGCRTRSRRVPFRVEGDADVPPVRAATVEDGASPRLHRDHGLTDPVEGVTPEGSVTVLYETDDAARIEFETDAGDGAVEPVQGWVGADALRTASSGITDLLRRGLEVGRRRGAGELLRMAAGYASNANPRNGVVHGRFE